MVKLLVHRGSRGFTLIEMSIVLVVIGLIVGGILVGQDLIQAAAARAQIAQIERYNTAVHTFQQKYNNQLPGDMDAVTASMFGFTPRSGLAGEGDGNGIIEGTAQQNGIQEGCCEVALFWIDLTTANGLNINLIPGQFTRTDTGGADYTTIAGIEGFFPPGNIGNGNYIYVYSWNGNNYFGLSAVYRLYSDYWLRSNPSLSVSQAYAIDRKADDGLPQTGKVTAKYIDSAAAQLITQPYYAAGGQNGGPFGPSDTSATQGSLTTCFDNGNTGGAAQQYSMEQNGGAGANCALSFQFQ